MPIRGELFTNRSSTAVSAALALTLLCSPLHASRKHEVPAPTIQRDAQDREISRRGVDILMDGDTDGALRVFQRVEQDDPQSPLGYLLEAQCVWWKIYLTTADLLDPDVFDVAKADSSPLDSHFADLVNTAIERSEAKIKAQEDVARNHLYEGMAYALQARLTGMRGKDLAAARAGKKMRTYLMEAMNLDSSLVDAELGLGTYNYFIDTLPPAIKLLRILGNVPGGDKDLGLRQIQHASEAGDLTRAEARFYLAKNYSTDDEKKYKKSLELFQGLARDFPRNPLWKLLLAEMQYRVGKSKEGDALYRQVAEQTSGMASETEHAVHRAARDGYLKRHPGDKTME